MTLLKYTAFAIFIACLAYMDHLNDRHPYGNWGFVWHQTKRAGILMFILCISQDIQDFLLLVLTAFFGQILIYNHFFNPDSQGFFQEIWNGIKSSFRWR